ncbi:MAG: hypothetical protein HY343_10025 [Lentisphaerae bacterium]|nr:hypothetical protein [Lentisphaerota bacterium]
MAVNRVLDDAERALQRDRADTAVRLYREAEDYLLSRRASGGEWNNLLFHYQRYCTYRLDSLRLRAELSGKASPSVAAWLSAMDRAEKRAKKAESETGARMDRDICLQLGKALMSADALCDAELWTEAVAYYGKILDYLQAFGTGEGEWGAAAHHLGVYACYRMEIIRLKQAPRATVATARREPVEGRSGFMDGMLADRLALGTRLTVFTLQTDNKKYFMGFIDVLEEEQDLWPTKVFAQWLFTPYVGLELTWDQVAAKLWNSEDIPHDDGMLSLRGPIVTLFGQYPNETIFTPYAGVGAGWFLADFDPNPIWHNGFGYEMTWDQAVADYEAWRAAGSPEWPNNGYQRILEPEDTYGLVLTAGSSIGINRRWAADLYLRYMWADVDAHYTRRVFGEVIDDRGTFTFPLSNFAAGLGVKYLF